MTRVFVLGLDGATFDVIRPLIARGALPTFARLMEKGAWGSLASTIPPVSPPAWTTFATGKNPGKHGIIGFTQLRCEDYTVKLVCGLDNRAKTLWNVVGEHGRRVVVVNVPMTYPPQPVNGLLVSGLDTPGLHAGFTYPPELKEEILTVAPDYSINLHLGGYLRTDARRREALRMILDSVDARFKVVTHLMRTRPWDLFVVRFNNPDIVQHHFWKYMDPNHPEHSPETPAEFRSAIATVYERLDRVAADILANLDEDTVLIVLSDHGAGPRINRSIHINEWLRGQGYLRLAADARAHRARPALRRSLHTPLAALLTVAHPALKRSLKRLFPRTFSRLSLLLKYSGGLSGIDWPATVAFAAEEDSVRINLKGQYPRGVVEPDAYEALRDELVARLSRLTDPDTGERLFERVLKREEAYAGAQAERLPDLLLVTNGCQYDVSTRFLGHRIPAAGNPCVYRQPAWSGANGRHRPNGILFMTGPGCRPQRELTNPSLVDVLPTVLFAMGLPIPSDADGRVLTEAFTDAHLGQHAVRYDAAPPGEAGRTGPDHVYSDDEQAALVAHLQELGYIQ
jgi:predicted AlkP superfamily phosphohydrolase/phosphomutase